MPNSTGVNQAAISPVVDFHRQRFDVLEASQRFADLGDLLEEAGQPLVWPRVRATERDVDDLRDPARSGST